MTSRLDQVDADSVDRNVAEMKKPDGNPSKHITSDDAEAFPASSSAALQFQADWSRFETVFARGMCT